jgi:hypothetical protein
MPKDNALQYPLGLGGREVVGMGITVVVARLDPAVKFSNPSEWHFMEREKLIYQRLHYDLSFQSY